MSDGLASLVEKYDLRWKDDPSRHYPVEEGSCGTGWMGLVEELVRQLIAAGWNRQVAEVRQKLGALRVYVGAATPEMEDLIDAAEAKSKTICETCGAPGVVRDESPLAAACDEHASRLGLPAAVVHVASFRIHVPSAEHDES